MELDLLKKANLHQSTSKPTRYGINSFRYEGTNILNILKDEPIYTNSKSKKEFVAKFKHEIIASYFQP